MDEERTAPPIRLEVKGPYTSNVSDLPTGVPATITESEAQKGLGAEALVILIFAVNWPALVSGIGINLFSQWLYDTFKKNRDNTAAREPVSTIEITVKGKNVTVIAADPRTVEQALREVVDAAESNR